MGLRNARKKARVKLKDAAGTLGVSKQAVNAWERGKYDPNIATLVKMAEMYGCTVDELLTPEKQKNNVNNPSNA